MAAQSAQLNQILAADRPTVAYPLQSTIKLVKLFQPTSIPGCAVWFDAADPYALNNQSTIATGTVISTFKNKGTAPSLQAQAAASVSPTYSSIASYPALAFNGFQALSTTAFTLSNTQGTTWFAAYATQANLAAAATAAIFGTIGFPERAIRQSNTSQFVGHSIHTGVTRTATDAGALNTLSFYTILDTPTVFTAFKNGSVLTSTTTNVTYMSGNSQNARIGIWDTTFAGSIAEIIAYDSPLTPAQRQQVEGYLAWKWGLQTALPATHPYLLFTPLAASNFPQIPFTRVIYNTSTSSFVTSGLIYHLDAGNPSSYPGSGSTWTDLAGSGTSLTLYGSPTYSAANGGSILFNPAASQYGQGTLSSTPQWTIEVFIYYNGTNTGTAPCIYTSVFPGSTNTIQAALGALGTFGGNCCPGSTILQAGYYNSGWWVTPAQSPLTSGNWYHIVGTYDATNLYLYINGSLNQTTASSATAAPNTAGFYIMRRWDNAEYWGGNLAILRRYNRALSGAEVLQNYTSQKSRFGL